VALGFLRSVVLICVQRALEEQRRLELLAAEKRDAAARAEAAAAAAAAEKAVAAAAEAERSSAKEAAKELALMTADTGVSKKGGKFDQQQVGARTVCFTSFAMFDLCPAIRFTSTGF
jgi:hypothetical protein